MQDEIKLLSPTETASRVSLSWRTVQRQVKIGQFPSPLQITPGRIAFRADEVNAWIEGRARTTDAA